MFLRGIEKKRTFKVFDLTWKNVGIQITLDITKPLIFVIDVNTCFE